MLANLYFLGQENFLFCPSIHCGIFVLHKVAKDDIIYTIVKKGDFHMVKSVCRIFLVAGIVSVFSFGYVNDAVAAKGCNTVDAGRYCLKKDNKRPCPEGCWCESKKNVNAVADILSNHTAVKHACSLRYSGVENELKKAGIHYCPEGQTTFESSDDNSGYGADEESDCKDGYTAQDGSLNCRNSVDKGRYCLKKDNRRDCPEGCYCEGKKDAIGEQWLDDSTWKTLPVKSWCNGHMNGSNSAPKSDYLEKRGIHYCPPEFPKSFAKMSKKEDCYALINNYKVSYMEISCDSGTYLPSIISDDACPTEYHVIGYYTWDVYDAYNCWDDNNHKGDFECKHCKEGYYCGGYNGPVGTSDGDNKGIQKCPNTLTSNVGAKDIKECYIKCGSGKYGKWDKDSYSCETCPNGCTCPGGTMYYTGKGWGEDFGKKCGSDNPPADSETGCDKNKYYVPATGRCKACPYSHLYSDGGYGTIKKCYCETSNGRLNYYPISCATGGGQGTSGNGITCDDGQYYDGEDCVPCPAGAYCKKGKAYKCGPRGYSAVGKSECRECENGFMANEDGTGCEPALISVEAGYYLPEDSVNQDPNCPNGKFCPGGKWLYDKNNDKGAFSCPPLTSLSGSPSSDNKDCNLNLTKEQMSYGIVGNKDCWKYATKENYVNCIFAGSGVIERVEDEEGITWIEDAKVHTDILMFDDYTNDGNYDDSGTTTGPDNPRKPGKDLSGDNTKSLATSTGNTGDVSANTTDYVAQAPDTLKQVSPGEPVKATPLSNATMVGGNNLTASPARSLRPVRSVRKR